MKTDERSTRLVHDLGWVRTWPEVAAEFNRRNSPPITRGGAWFLHESAMKKLRSALADLEPDWRADA